MEKAGALEKAGQRPASYVADRFATAGEFHTLLRNSVATWLQDHGSTVELLKLEDVVFPATTTRVPIMVPIDSISWKVPSSGLPPALDWGTHLVSIVTDNYDSRRVPIDIRPTVSDLIGKPLGPASVCLVKGFTRTSIIAFALMVVFGGDFDVAGISDDDSEMLTRPGESQDKA